MFTKLNKIKQNLQNLYLSISYTLNNLQYIFRDL